MNHRLIAPFLPLRFDNDAGRLLAVVEFILTQKDTTLIHVAWRKALFDEDVANGNVITEHYPQLLIAFADLNALLDRIESDLRDECGDHLDVYEWVFPTLRLIVSPANVNDALNNHFTHFQQAKIGLAMIAKDLPKHESVSFDDLAHLHTEIVSLFNKIESLAIENKFLKRWMLDQLRALLNGLGYYRSNGARGLRKALAQFYGELAINGATLANANDVPDEIKSEFWSAGANVLEISIKISTILSPVVALAQLATSLLKGDVPSLPLTLNLPPTLPPQ
jgi:hypothetical protein